MLEQLQRHWPRAAGSLVILAFFVAHAAQFHRWDFVERMESIAYDARLLFTMPETVDDRIVIVDIDEKSLQSEGRWPWSRAKMAKLMDRLFGQYEVALVGFDVVFAEPEEVSGLQVLEALRADVPSEVAGRIETLRSSLDHDAAFARSMESRPVILGYFFTDPDEAAQAPRIGMLPPPVFVAGQFAGRGIDFLKAAGYGANLPALQGNALGAGHFLTTPDGDGVVRRVPMLYEFEGSYYESLSLAVARHILGVDRLRPGYPPESRAGKNYSGMEWIEVGDRKVPVDRHVRTLIPFRGKQGSFPYVSATDVLQGSADASVLRGRVVLVGPTAKGLFDLRATPVQPNYPGVEVHANLIAGIVDDNIKQNPAYTLGAEVVLLVISGLIMAIVLPILSPLWATGATLLLLAGMIGVNLYIWESGNFVFPLASGLLAVLAMFLFNMTYGYFFEQRGKRQLAGLFGQYVPPELVDEMSDHPEQISMVSESREMTVLFSDVRGFTTISEGLEPRELSELMNAFLTPMTKVIHQHRGTIDKYMGDAIMAFWGAPLHDPDHARHALEAALEMIVQLDNLQADFRDRGWPEIHIGVGLNSGSMSVGNMGSEFRMAYTVLGDAVNLGSRLEGLTKQYGVQVIVNETTAAAVPDYLYRELDRVRVKGKDVPVTIFEPLGPRDAVDKAARDELKVYREALRLYRAQNWDIAEIQFLNLQQRAPERLLYQIYAERIAHYRESPPPADWDGVFTHMTK
ncbi:MAG: adenylate/guanylate cyclase domain-containing protein [Ectothiorhodospiraceae bacterium]|nr:adenylate/guanylate cyclase domain-containing protein [Chromatiales bacterium]MCP5155007.1 adenylate/guanylate cyclase domain-containing protein [Ectothiorhodospiraceae bacterium]